MRILIEKAESSPVLLSLPLYARPSMKGLIGKPRLNEDLAMEPDLATDVKVAISLFAESAVEMYRKRGYSNDDAKKMAEELINSPAKHQLPEFDDL